MNSTVNDPHDSVSFIPADSAAVLAEIHDLPKGWRFTALKHPDLKKNDWIVIGNNEEQGLYQCARSQRQLAGKFLISHIRNGNVIKVGKTAPV